MLRLRVLAVAFLATLSQVLYGQQQSCNRVYVDPVLGDDAHNGSLYQPLKTIAAGIQALVPLQQGTVVLLPGTYSTTMNGETIPIGMKPSISIQGTNALNTIVDGQGADVFVFGPQPPGIMPSYAGTFINGLTIRNGGRGVVLDQDEPLLPTISNCFIVDNCVGIWMDGGTAPVPSGLAVHRPTIIHNTIADNTIGIYDFAVHAGVGVSWADPAIINCLIYPNGDGLLNGADLIGTTQADLVGSAYGTRGGGGNHPCGVGVVTACGNPQDPCVPFSGTLSGVDPDELYISRGTGDYRLLPTAIVVDAGSTALQTSHSTPTIAITSNPPCSPDALVVDCEGHGNPRFERNMPDIGADELGQLIIAGYDPGTTRFSGTNPNPTRILYMTPFPPLGGSMKKAIHYLTVSTVGYNSQQPFSTPGVNPYGSTTCVCRSGGVPCPDVVCVDTTMYAPGFPALLNQMPDVGVPLMTTLSQGDPGAEQYCLQILPKNGAGQTTPISNLQCYVVVETAN